MNHYHRNNLFSEIRESHQVPIKSDWAYAIRKQARLMLLPLFREVIVCWKELHSGKRPFLTELAEELLRGFFATGNIRVLVFSEAEKIVSNFIGSLSQSELAVLGFYFLSNQKEVDIIFQEILDRDESEDNKLEEDEKEVGRIFLDRFQKLSGEDLTGFLLEELGEIENILSNSDFEIDLDTEAITRINETFSDYLDLPHGEISLIQMPMEDWDFWKKVSAEEPETVGKKFHKSKGLEWAECWLLPHGEIKIKGNLEDPGERDQAAIVAIREELSVILRSVQEQLKGEYKLLDNQILYTFITQRKSLENILIEEGIEFFNDQIDAHGSDGCELMINIDIQRYSNNELEQWGTQIRMDTDSRYWLSEDQTYEFKVWVLVIENEETALETRFNQYQKRSIIQEILKNINTSYQLRKEA